MGTQSITRIVLTLSWPDRPWRLMMADTAQFTAVQPILDFSYTVLYVILITLQSSVQQLRSADIGQLLYQSPMSPFMAERRRSDMISNESEIRTNLMPAPTIVLKDCFHYSCSNNRCVDLSPRQMSMHQQRRRPARWEVNGNAKSTYGNIVGAASSHSEWWISII